MTCTKHPCSSVARACPQAQVKSRAALRAWLADTHATAGPVWPVVNKQPSPHCLPWGDAVAKLLCRGSIDSVTRRVDDAGSSYRVLPRTPASARSAMRVTQAGKALIAAALVKGMWAVLDDVDRLEVPGDLAAALGEALRPAWDRYPRCVKRGTLAWIKTAKSAPTRATRIDDVVASARHGPRPSPFRR
ncbi:YdeI/OmpD-associated family protein [uncultured Tateyamaria sp.]|uniref:YdeI/OmpD-associated family protein n=1 Tax=Tateyamaria sp. 1078 TaxID=3417464 RepID=UPI0026016B6E|nr:YdeI/OmpD-associated family protein [uncultured Tateyamaria sp.]